MTDLLIIQKIRYNKGVRHCVGIKGGYGIIITEDFAVTRTAGASKTLAGLWEDRQIEPWSAFTDRIHKAGAITIAQIYHNSYNNSLGNLIFGVNFCKALSDK